MSREKVEKLIKYQSVFDEMDIFVYENEDGTADVEFWSPAGEDMYFTVDIENFAHNIYEEYDNFDIDEHIEMWIEARKSGVSIRRLCQDAEDISDFLGNFAMKLYDIDRQQN